MTFDLVCLLLFLIQGPQGRSGLSGLPGADGPPVRALATYIRSYCISVLHTYTVYTHKQHHFTPIVLTKALGTIV